MALNAEKLRELVARQTKVAVQLEHGDTVVTTIKSFTRRTVYTGHYEYEGMISTHEGAFARYNILSITPVA